MDANQPNSNDRDGIAPDLDDYPAADEIAAAIAAAAEDPDAAPAGSPEAARNRSIAVLLLAIASFPAVLVMAPSLVVAATTWADPSHTAMLVVAILTPLSVLSPLPAVAAAVFHRTNKVKAVAAVFAFGPLASILLAVAVAFVS